MAKSDNTEVTSFPAEVRRIETPYAETGAVAAGSPSGYVDRVDVTYEVGFEKDGAWVKISSVPSNTVDGLVTAAAAAAASSDAPAPEASA